MRIPVHGIVRPEPEEPVSSSLSWSPEVGLLLGSVGIRLGFLVPLRVGRLRHLPDRVLRHGSGTAGRVAGGVGSKVTQPDPRKYTSGHACMS